jgi:hypothetical protein
LQFAQANAQTKNCKRACFANAPRPTKMNRQLHDSKEGRSANSGFAKWRVSCFYDSLVQCSSSVFQMNICAENPPLRKAEKRYSKIDKLTRSQLLSSSNFVIYP